MTTDQPETLPVVLHGFRRVKSIDPTRARWATPAEQEAFNRGLAEGRRQHADPPTCEACQAPMTLTACLSCVTREALERGRAEGIAQGSRQAVEFVSSLLGHDLVLDRTADVDSVGLLSSAIVTARELGRRQATEGKRLVVEWGARVDEPHPARHEKVGDVIKLGEPSARHAPTIWAGWTTVRRERLVGPWEPAVQPEAARRDRYMMATSALHKLGDISRDEPDLAIIYGDSGDDWVGQWVTGIGYINVRFPKATTRELTDAEKATYSKLVIDEAGSVRPIVFDEPASGGVVEPSPLTWTANVPYTPIVPGPNVLDLRPPETLTVHLDNREARFVPADPPVPRSVSTLHERLLAELDRLDPHRLTTLGKVTAAVLELHAPVFFGGHMACLACSPGMPPPILVLAKDCSTIQVIAREMGVPEGADRG